MIARAVAVSVGFLAASGLAHAAPATPEEVATAYHIFFPGAVGPTTITADAGAVIAKGLDGDWYRADLVGLASPGVIEKVCADLPNHITTAPDEITIVQGSKSGSVTYRYTFVAGSLFSEWVDIPALFARLGIDKMPDDEKRRRIETNILRSNSGYVVFVRPSENTLYAYSLAGGPRLYARCG